MNIVTRKEAKGHGLARYFTGKKCKNGHLSERYTANSGCIECHEKIRNNPSKRPEYSRRYEKTKSGFLVRLYRNMKSRISGVQHDKFHLYEGKDLLSKSEFYSWANRSQDFYELFDAYEKSGYERRLAPSVDRIDPSIGYRADNMQWVTHSENSRRGAAV